MTMRSSTPSTPSQRMQLAPLSRNTLDDGYLPPPADGVSTRMASPTAGPSTPSSMMGKKASTPTSSCNFDAFSLHFHLPLKAAAEKFGVRATAFKKRCRAIGIRHWPYRKVRSLKRSLQELNRCKEQGALNEKQQYQYTTFKKQLDKLMSPETYGIDASGKIPHPHFPDDDDEDSGEEEHPSYPAQSPRYGLAFMDCSISPVEGEKTFGDFSHPVQLRSLRKQHAAYMPSSHLSKGINSSAYLSDLPAIRFGKDTPLNVMSPFYSKYAFGGHPYDHYLHDPLGLDLKATHPMKLPHVGSDGSSSISSETHERGRTPHLVESSSDGKPEEIASSSKEGKCEVSETFSNETAQEEFQDQTNQMDYGSERFFDDVFLQISPDYGCLV